MTVVVDDSRNRVKVKSSEIQASARSRQTQSFCLQCELPEVEADVHCQDWAGSRMPAANGAWPGLRFNQYRYVQSCRRPDHWAPMFSPGRFG